MTSLGSMTASLTLTTIYQEYATEVDVDFVRKSVRAIGRCAIKVKIDLYQLYQYI